MGRARLWLLLALIGAGVIAVAESSTQVLAGVPQPVLVGTTAIFVVVVWVSVAVLTAKSLYWLWKRIDTSVFKLWNHLVPESPVVRFATGVTILLFVGVIAPLWILQASDLVDEGDVEEQLAINETTDPDDIPEATPENNTTESTNASTQHINQSKFITNYHPNSDVTE